MSYFQYFTKWQHKYLIATRNPNEIVHSKTNEYTGQMNLEESKHFLD